MIRIKGTIGDWPVDLTVELDEQDWARLGQHLALDAPDIPAPAPAPRVSQDEAVWLNAQALLRDGGPVSGPQLLAQLDALAGGNGAGKRLLVRLRHCAQVKVENGGDAPVYSWVQGGPA